MKLILWHAWCIASAGYECPLSRTSTRLLMAPAVTALRAWLGVVY